MYDCARCKFSWNCGELCQCHIKKGKPPQHRLDEVEALLTVWRRNRRNMSHHLPYGTAVMTTERDDSDDWQDNNRPDCRWRTRGRIIKHSDSHGLCYEVKHADGSSAWYNPGELVVDVEQ